MIQAVALDLDGTVYRSGQALPGAAAAVLALRAAGLGVVFASNNPTVGRDAYAERLTQLGIPATPDDTVTSGHVTGTWLRENHPLASVLLVSEPVLRAELQSAGVRLTDEPLSADIVVVSFDRTFDYHKWTGAFTALRGGALFVATNPDATCPIDGGEVPDCGGIIAALEVSSGRPLDIVIGKPSPIMADAVLRQLRLRTGLPTLAPGDVLVVGDRLETDVGLGVSGGFRSALVLTGVTRPEDVVGSALRPDDVLAGLHELPALLEISATAVSP